MYMPELLAPDKSITEAKVSTHARIVAAVIAKIKYCTRGAMAGRGGEGTGVDAGVVRGARRIGMDAVAAFAGGKREEITMPVAHDRDASRSVS